MAASQEQKVDFLLKKIGYVQSKTGLAEDSSGLTGTKKKPTEENKPSPLVIPSTNVWADSTLIPNTPPTSSTTYVGIYTAANAFQLTYDNTVFVEGDAQNKRRTFIARTSYGTQGSSLITGDWIDPSFGQDYAVRVFKGDPNSGGVELPSAQTNEEWFFDYSSGILNFNGTNVPSGIGTDNVYILGYKYTGAKGIQPPAGISSYIASFSNDVTFIGTSTDYTITWDSSDNTLKFADNVKATFGDGNDLEIYHNGNNSVIHNVGVGTLYIDSASDVIISEDSVTARRARFVQDGAVELYYDNSLKFQTVESGVSISNGTSDTSTIFGTSNLIIDPSPVGVEGVFVLLESYNGDVVANATEITGISTDRILIGNYVNAIDGVISAGTTVVSIGNNTIGIGTTALGDATGQTFEFGDIPTSSGNVYIKGDLYVQGKNLQVDSTTVNIADKVIGIATTCTDDVLLNGGGIGIGADGNRKTFLYEYNSGTNPSLKSSENLNIASDKVYQIDQTERLSADTLSLGTGTTIHSPDSNVLILGTDSSERIRIDSNGNIGIGTTIPNSILHVNGTSLFVGIATFKDRVIFDSTNSIQIPVGTTTQRDAVGTAVTGQIRYNTTNSTFEGYGPGGYWGSLGGVIDVDRDTYISAESSPNDDNDELNFYTRGDFRAIIDSNGNVGIGTSTPNKKLDIVGDLNVSDTATIKEVDAERIISKLYVENHINDFINIEVKYIDTKTSNHRHFGVGDDVSFQIEEVEAPYIQFIPGKTYRFNQNDSSNLNHQLRFYLESNKTTEFTDGVSFSGTIGVDGYTQIVVTESTPSILYYESSNSNDSLIGNQIQTISSFVYEKNPFIVNDKLGILNNNPLHPFQVGVNNKLEVVVSAAGTIGVGSDVIIGINTDGIAIDQYVTNGVVLRPDTQVTAIGSSTVSIGLTALTDTDLSTGFIFEFSDSTDNSDVVFITSDGRMGIGASIPVAQLDVVGHTEVDTINISAASTFGGNIDANANLDVDGHTELDTLNVSAASTFKDDIRVIFDGDPTSSIGIGTTVFDPLSDYILDIRGKVNIIGALFVGGTDVENQITSDVGTFVSIGTTDLYVSGIATFGPNSTVDVKNGIGITGGDVSIGTAGTGFYYDNSEAKVGIGTTLPQYKLDVHGDVNVTGYTTTKYLTVGTGTSAYTFPDYDGPTNSVLKTDSNGNVEWAASSALRNQYEQTAGSGGVGLTTFFVSYTPNLIDVYLNGVKLASTDYTATNGTSITLSTDALNGDTLQFVAFDNDSVSTRALLDYWKGDESGNIFNITDNVGIGSTLPTAKLDVNGSVRISGTLFDVNAGYGATGEAPVSDGNGGWIWSSIAAGSVTGAGNYKNIQFKNQVGATAGSDEFNFDPVSNRVGIGSLTPRAKLDVRGTTHISDITQIGDLEIRPTGIVTAVSGSTKFDIVDTQTGDIGIHTTIITGITTGTLSLGLEVQNQYVPSGTEIISIGVGEVGIGTTTTNTSIQNGETFVFGNTIDGYNTYYGDGRGLTNLNASQLSSGTVPQARLSGTYNISISGSIDGVDEVIGIGTITVNDDLTVGTGDTTVTADSNGNLNVTGITTTGTLYVGAAGTIGITTILDEDNMVSDSDTALATQQSIKKYVDDQITAQDLDITDGTTTSAVDLDSQTLTIQGTSNEVDVALSGQSYTVGLKTDVTVQGTLTANVGFANTMSFSNTITGIGTTTSKIFLHAELEDDDYRSVEYSVQASQGTNFHFTKLLVVHDGNNAYLTEYGTVYNSSEIASYNVELAGGYIALSATAGAATTANYVINFTANKVF